MVFKVLFLVPAHNEADRIDLCLLYLNRLELPEGFTRELLVGLDRCEDKTGEIAERMGASCFVRRSVGKFADPILDNIAYGIARSESDLVLVCDADIQQIPRNALLKLIDGLNGVDRVSARVKTRSGKWWLDWLFLLQDLNRRIALSEHPRGAFTLFHRETWEMCEPEFPLDTPSWDTCFDQAIKRHGGRLLQVKDVVVVEKRAFSLRRILRHQVSSGVERRRLGIGFWRTLLHSVFRGRFLVLYGYFKEMKK